MSKVDTERRIYYDSEDIEVLNRLMREKPFDKLSHNDFFALCLVHGKRQGFGTPLGSKKTGRIREATISKNLRYLMMAIAIEESGELEVIADKNKYFTICEEYAKTGLMYLEKKYVESSDILDDLEFEVLEFYDEYIEESED